MDFKAIVPLSLAALLILEQVCQHNNDMLHTHEETRLSILHQKTPIISTGSTLPMSSSRVVTGEKPNLFNSRDNWVLAQKLDKKYNPLDISFKRKYHKR